MFEQLLNGNRDIEDNREPQTNCSIYRRQYIQKHPFNFYEIHGAGDKVLMQDERHVRLADFGISKILQDVSSTSTSGVGTTRWMAPEIMDVEALNLKHNEKADIWSVGCTVIEMITAKSPYMEFLDHHVPFQIQMENIPSLGTSITPSNDLICFLTKTLHKHANNRPTALDLLKNDNFVATGALHKVVLVGRSNGKTSCRDTLMGRSLNNTTVSPTLGFAYDYIQVFDMPSVDDMCIYEEMVQFYENAIKVMNAAKEGVTAFLLVLRYGKRYTKQDHDLILSLKDFFGDDFLRKYCIVLFTHGDIFSDDLKLFTFKEWCDWQDGYLELLYMACNKRFVLMFNNSTDNTQHKCRNEVFEFVYKLSQQQEPYTLTDFKNHQTAREQNLLYMPSTDKIGVIQLVFISYCQDAENIMKANNCKGFEEMKTKSQYFKDRISVERENFNRSTVNSDVLKKEIHEEINRELNKLEISFTNVDNTIRSFFASEISCTDAEIVIKALRKDFKCDSTENAEGLFPKITTFNIGRLFKKIVSSVTKTKNG
ncbi:uncharacterized protein LOC131934697 isoform X2 [Physella acuta]|uniref:uncharacterized protein LOC131934697 isoform X2 n=1 Tax=Physella acuta TaxID=109671 RepID=UPI0027DC82C5|nr:uncharacterized protein LOC131934697 isoform X2 [Physella acuta]